MSWTAGVYFSKGDEEKTREFLEAQGLDGRQVMTIETFIRQKIVAGVYFYSSFGAAAAAVVGIGAFFLLK